MSSSAATATTTASASASAPVSSKQLPLTNQGLSLIIINIVFLALPLLCIVVRLWSRKLQRLALRGDDYCVILAGIVWTGQVAFNLWITPKQAIGYHIEVAGPKAAANLLMQLSISQFMYAAQFFLIRLSICLLLIRIFSVQTWLRYCIYVAIGINTCWLLYIVISQAVLCIPFQANWDPTMPGATCHNDQRLNIYVANAIWSVIYDTAILVIPQPSIWQLHMPKSSRAALSGVFLLGAIDIIISIIRIVFIVHLNFEDVTFSAYYSEAWSILEIGIATIVVNLPSMRPAIVKMFPCSTGLLSALRSKITTRGMNISSITVDPKSSNTMADETGLVSSHGPRTWYGVKAYHNLDEESQNDHEMGTIETDERAHTWADASQHESGFFEPGVVHMKRDVSVIREDGVDESR